MKRAGVLLCFIGLAACGPPVTRTREEIFKLKDALERSRIDDGVLLDSRMLANPDASVWENSGKYQGDIVLDDSQLEELVSDYASGGTETGTNRNAFVVANTKWPGNVMIYQFGVNEFDSAQQRAILTAMSWVEHFSCVRFRRRTNERVVVTMTGKPDGCYAHVGFSTAHPNRIFNLARNRPGHGCFNHVVIIHELLHNLGFQHMHQNYERNNFVRVNWANIMQYEWVSYINNLAHNRPSHGCFNHVVIIHELLHNLGFQHMHQTYERNNFVRINWANIMQGELVSYINNLARNRPGHGCFNHVVIIHELLHNLGLQHMHQTYERNNFVRINWANIMQGYSFAFDQYRRNQVNLLGLPYEYTSSMHYGAHAFSANRQPTMTALRNFQGTMGQRDHATYWDWLRLRRHYNCPGAWSQRDMDKLKEEVDRAMPLMKMNLPAPKKGLFTDEDNKYVEALSSQLSENPVDEEITVNEDFVLQENAVNKNNEDYYDDNEYYNK